MEANDRIANLQISGDKHMWKLLGPGMYNARPLFPVTLRELLQNAHDAQKIVAVTRPIEFELARDAAGSYELKCSDYGIGMDEATIHDKFLILGSSGKEEGVGGFGVAKASILGACSSWKLHTLDNFLADDMLGKSAIVKTRYRPGCEIILKYDANENAALKPVSWAIRDALCYLATSDVATKTVMRQGDSVVEWASSGLRVDEKRLVATIEDDCNILRIYLVPKIRITPVMYFGYSTTSTTEYDINGKIIYRLNGLTQYLGYSSNGNADFNAVVDVTTKARPRDLSYPFTVSREEMTDVYRSQVNEKLDELFVNHLSTELLLKEKTGEKTVAVSYYDGSVCASYGQLSTKRARKEEKRQEQEQAEKQQRESLNQELSETMAGFVADAIEPAGDMEDVAEKSGGILKEDVKVILREQLERSPTGIKTCIMVADSYRRTKVMTKRNVRLLQAWTMLIGAIMQSAPGRYRHSFGVGLILDDDYCALRRDEGSVVYYMFNPLKHKVSDAMNTALLMMLSACHEITHTSEGNHDENFTVAEDRIRARFLEHHGMAALYALGRFIRSGKQ